MINLLPQTAQAENARDYARRRRTVAFFLSAGLGVAATVLFVPILIAARSEQASLEESLALTRERIKNGEAAGVAEQVRKLNGLLASVPGTALSETKTPALFLEHLRERVPSGIELTHVDYDRGKELAGQAKITVEGIAATRESVLAFAKALGGDSLFSNVDSPISNLVHPAKISFVITAHISVAP